MKAMRLLILANYLETLPDERFFMGSWFNDCGTTACAMGHATNIPQFRDLGLTTVKCSLTVDTAIPVFDGRRGFQAAMAFFDINYDDAIHLFGGHPNGRWYRKPLHMLQPSDVAKGIKLYVALKTQQEACT